MLNMCISTRSLSPTQTLTHATSGHLLKHPAAPLGQISRASTSSKSMRGRAMLLLLVGRAATTRLPHPTRLTPSRKAPAIRCCASDASTSLPPSSPALGESKSTLQFEEEPFHEGAAQRAAALGTALHERGFEAARLQALLTDPSYKGSPALRTYNSFVYPKSAASLANAEKPGRMVTIAQSIVFLVREQAAKEAAWLRNVDRAREEVDALAGERLPLHLVLDNIRSAHNVGNLLRAAEAARLEGVHACGITPTPPHPSLLKTAMGAAEYVPNSHDGSTLRVVRELKRRGVSVWACETTAKSVDLREAVLPKPLALVLGNELLGGCVRRRTKRVGRRGGHVGDRGHPSK